MAKAKGSKRKIAGDGMFAYKMFDRYGAYVEDIWADNDKQALDLAKEYLSSPMIEAYPREGAGRARTVTDLEIGE